MVRIMFTTWRCIGGLLPVSRRRLLVDLIRYVVRTLTLAYMSNMTYSKPREPKRQATCMALGTG